MTTVCSGNTGASRPTDGAKPEDSQEEPLGGKILESSERPALSVKEDDFDRWQAAGAVEIRGSPGSEWSLGRRQRTELPQVRVVSFSGPPALYLALDELRRQGLTPRGLLFLALDPSGEVQVSIPERIESVTRIRVGDKLSLKPPGPRRSFHFDSIHRLPGEAILWNGDRRLAHPGSAEGTALAVTTWLKQHGAKNVFLGCTPHRPGTWYYAGASEPPVALHASGLLDAVPAATGLLARRVAKPTLEYLSYAALASDAPLTSWQPVFESPLGRILMIERRILGGHLVLTCEEGLVEVDITELPRVREQARAIVPIGMAVVGRIDGGAFAVTRGKVEHTGLVDLEPATLVGMTGTTLAELTRSLGQRPRRAA